MKKILKIFLINILFINILYSSDLFTIINKDVYYQNLNEYVQKENQLYDYIKKYFLSTFDNDINRKSIAEYYNKEVVDLWQNYSLSKCPATIDNVYYSSIGCIDFSLTSDKIILQNSLSNNANNINDTILNIYQNNSYQLPNSYVSNKINRIYINDNIFKYAYILKDYIYKTGYSAYLSEEEDDSLITNRIWLKPNGINGLTLYIYDTTEKKWFNKGTIAYSLSNPYTIEVESDLFNPDTFPGVLNMKANILKGSALIEYYFDGTSWVNQTLSNSGTSFFNGYSNILPLTTDLLTKIGQSVAYVTDDVFFSDKPKAVKYDVEELDSNENKLDYLGFWKTEDEDNLFTDTFTNNIHYINTYSISPNYIFYHNSSETTYIPMKKLLNNKWVYLSKTNGYDGILDYPYNENENSSGPNIGTDTSNTEHYIISWDTKNVANGIRLASEKQYFKYNENDKVFYSKYNYDLTTNETIQISEYRTYFNKFNSNYTYYSKYSQCNNTTNLGDSKCHNNTLFAGDKKDNLYVWYYIDGALYDAHKVTTYQEMYLDKNDDNNNYPLVIFNNELYDLVLDSNNNICYQRRIDGKYYTINGQIIPFYDNGIGVLPLNKTCENVTINANGYIKFEDLVDLVTNYDKAPNLSIGYVTSKNKNYNKSSNGNYNFWCNNIDKIYVTKDSRNELNLNGVDYNYLSLLLGEKTDPFDNDMTYRYTNNGINYTSGNTNENNNFKSWFNINVDKSLNSLIDADCANVKYTGNPCDGANGFQYNENTKLCEKQIYKNKEDFYGIVSYTFTKNQSGKAPPGGGYTLSFSVNYPIGIQWRAYSEDTQLNVKVDNVQTAYWAGKSWEGKCDKNLIISNGGCAIQSKVDYFERTETVNKNFYLSVIEGGSASTPVIGYSIKIILLSNNYLQNQYYPLSISGATPNYGWIKICPTDYKDNGNNCVKTITQNINCTNSKMIVYPYLDTLDYLYNDGNCYSELAKICVNLGYDQKQIFEPVLNGQSCDDNNIQTINDIYVNDICIGTNVEGQSCNDNNSQTINDIYTNGICIGEDIEGNYCDDGLLYTVNDTYHNGICSGIDIRGVECDDENSKTINDVYNSNGVCEGTNVEGQSCDDGNAATINDIYTNGVCIGTTVTTPQNNCETGYTGVYTSKINCYNALPNGSTSLKNWSLTKLTSDWLKLGNNNLTDIDGLITLTYVNGLYLDDNAELANLDGLSNLKTIGSFGFRLYYTVGQVPIDLSGLANVKTVNGDIRISKEFATKNLISKKIPITSEICNRNKADEYFTGISWATQDQICDF